MVATEQRKILSDQAFLKDARIYYTRILRIALRYLADCLRSGRASVQAVEVGSSFPSVIGLANAPGCPVELRLDRWDAATCLKIAEFLDTITQDTGESKVLSLVIGNRKWFAKPVQAVVYAVRNGSGQPDTVRLREPGGVQGPRGGLSVVRPIGRAVCRRDWGRRLPGQKRVPEQARPIPSILVAKTMAGGETRLRCKNPETGRSG
jgi:hypothetical protein